MGKRSSLARIPRDLYQMPEAAPDGARVRHLEANGLLCAYAGDIATGPDV